MDSTLKKLECTREQMIQSGIENGFLSNKTIQLSKKLDELLNAYQTEMNYKNNKMMSMKH